MPSNNHTSACCSGWNACALMGRIPAIREIVGPTPQRCGSSPDRIRSPLTTRHCDMWNSGRRHSAGSVRIPTVTSSESLRGRKDERESDRLEYPDRASARHIYRDSGKTRRLGSCSDRMEPDVDSAPLEVRTCGPC